MQLLLTLSRIVPQPRKRDTLLQKLRSSYESIAKKAGETVAYPGNWLYESWSESDLKEWLDTHGFPAPQPTTVRYKVYIVIEVLLNTIIARQAYCFGQTQFPSGVSEGTGSGQFRRC